jgi:anti-sigma regulatory factor (Ser/Thr protein kinase)
VATEQDHYEAVFPAVPSSVARARHEVSRFGEDHGGDPERIGIAVSEAVSNVVRHAYCGREAPVSIEADLDERAVVVTVQDRGVGLSPAGDPSGPGFGLPLIGSLADHLVVDSLGWGVTVQMRFARN